MGRNLIAAGELVERWHEKCFDGLHAHTPPLTLVNMAYDAAELN
jgi:hypothetical protein